MASTQNIGESSDNPVAINVTAMVDVIFCLCIFFMCSFKFKQLEGKIESWLPKDRGNQRFQPPPVLEEIRIFMRWEDGRTIRRVGSRLVDTDDALIAAVLSQVEDYRKMGWTEFPVLIDSLSAVPWRDVVHVMDLCKARGLDRIDFTQP